MISALKYRLTNNWHFTRFAGLVLGVFFGIQALVYKEPLAGFVSVFFLIQVVTNTGCFGGGNCAVPRANASDEIEDVEFTEIKKEK